MLINEKVYDIEECDDIFKYLDTLDVEYRKPYSRFGKTVHVPRGQASFTLSPDIHYDYIVYLILHNMPNIIFLRFDHIVLYLMNVLSL